MGMRTCGGRRDGREPERVAGSLFTSISPVSAIPSGQKKFAPTSSMAISMCCPPLDLPRSRANNAAQTACSEAASQSAGEEKESESERKRERETCTVFHEVNLST